MKIILLSGGSGKRLWPLSNDIRSKQFLKLLESDSGQPESMVQRVWRQLEASGLSSSSYITTNKAQVEILQNQLGQQLPLIVEPKKRDTFPAISLASAYFATELNFPEDEIACVIPVDLYVQDSFFRVFNKIERALRQSGAPLALVGVKPSFPAETYGYMIPKKTKVGEELYLQISSFREKPDVVAAQKLIEQGALWNCGIFAFKLGFMKNFLIERKWPFHYREMLEQYGSLPKRSFDYEVVEGTPSIIAIPYEGEWTDIGTWDSLTKTAAKQIAGKGRIEGCANTHLINELGIPVLINGMDDSIVVASHDGILVSSKSSSAKIKDFVEAEAHRPMYEEKRWGSYRVIDFEKWPDGSEVLTKRLKILPGKSLSYQYHLKRMEVWTIIAGTGEMLLDGKITKINSGDVIYIPKEAKHAVRAIGEALEVIEVQMGSELIEEDIVRLYASWEEAEELIRGSVADQKKEE